MASSNSTLETDVLIVGGGTAGTIAAIQSGRLGASTVLVELASQLGGTTTTAGVDFPGLFHAWGRQVIGGIGWELVIEAVKLNADKLPDFSVPTGREHWRHQVRICGPLYAALAEEACSKAGVKLRHYETPLTVKQSDGMWKLLLVGKGTQLGIRARQLIDCTGNAAVIAMAGLQREREQESQPGTLIYRLGGYTYQANNEEWLRELGLALREAVREGRLLETDYNHNIRKFLSAYGQNAMHVPGADSSTSETQTETNKRARASLLRVMRFLRTQPGFESLRVERLQPECGVRETWRIVGEKKVTKNDYVAGRNFPDAIAYSFYPLDLHDEKGVRPSPLAEGTVPTIPLGALVPKASRNILAAGRCISSDRMANSALRVQASCMAMGQAVGVAAALAAKADTTPGKLSLASVRSALTAHGAIVPNGS